jgi:nitrite reductase/ring-hydroxylating ferredoxin subunit
VTGHAPLPDAGGPSADQLDPAGGPTDDAPGAPVGVPVAKADPGGPDGGGVGEVAGGAGGPVWVDVGSAREVERRRKVVVEHAGRRVVVLWHDGAPRALDDVCIHKQKLLSGGVVLGGRIVCPGHQWAFDLDTGHCAARDRHQPVYRAEAVDGRVRVDVSAPVVAGEAVRT